MIDPKNVTNYNYSDYDLQEFLLFCLAAANNNAYNAAKSIDSILGKLPGYLPFDRIRRYVEDYGFESFVQFVKSNGLGKYSVKSKGMFELSCSNFNLRNVSVLDLEKITGIGPKTSRFFVLHTRRNACYAVLDTHLLKHMKKLGFDVPKNTPSGKKYQLIENQLLEMVEKSGMTPAEYDLFIWKQYSSS